MWNIFPQLAGLGHSTIAQHFAIANKEHAAAYLALPVLGQRLHECAALVNSHARTSAAQIFGLSGLPKAALIADTISRSVTRRGEFYAGAAAVLRW